MKINTNIKILAIILLAGFGLSSFILTASAALPAGYPYTVLQSPTVGATACRSGDKSAKVIYVDIGGGTKGFKEVCVPGNATAENLGSSGCRPGLEEISVPEATRPIDQKLCVSTAKGIESVRDIECQLPAKKILRDLNDPNSYVCAFEITNPAKECPLAINRFSLNDKLWCLTEPTKIIGASGELIIPGGGAIKTDIRPYVVSFPIPCRVIPGIGGECPSAVTTPAQYVTRLYQFGLMIAGFAAFASIVYGAIKYILSAGIVSMQQDAKDQITSAILGLILLLGAFLILFTINPELVNLRNPNLPPLNLKSLFKEEAAGGPDQLTGSGEGGAGDDLCALKVNAQIDVNANANLQNRLPGEKPVIDLSKVQLPKGTQATGFKCINCKENAHRVGGTLGVGGTCECNAGYAKLGGRCLSFAECTESGGQISGEQGKIGGSNCLLTGPSPAKKTCNAAGGVCQKNTGPTSCVGGHYEKNLCPGAAEIQCCLKS